MIFEQSNIAFQILDVMYLRQEQTKTYNHNRNFDALSLRLNADTVLSYNDKEFEAPADSICYFPSNVNYSRVSNKDEMLVIHFKTFNYHSNDIEIFIPENIEKYKELFWKIFEIWDKKSISYKYDAASILNMIFAEFYKDNKPKDSRDKKIREGVDYIKENCLKTDFYLPDAAAKSAVSETYFRRLFKKEYGISPKQYVINRRLKYAASMIVAGYYTLEEISCRCGYSDYKHFSSEFKKIMGVSPSKYRYEFSVHGNDRG